MTELEIIASNFSKLDLFSEDLLTDLKYEYKNVLFCEEVNRIPSL